MTTSTLRLTPTELYFLGVQMKARYIDYAYIAAMPDIQKRYAIREQETLDALEERGLLEEDFSGNVEVEDEVAELLTPVFQGTVESRVIAPGIRTNVHVHQSGIVTAAMGEDQISFKAADDDALKALLARAAKTDAPVTVSCSKVGGGVKEKVFEARQLAEEGVLSEALRIMKGEHGQ